MGESQHELALAMGRTFRIDRCAGQVCRASFAELCERDRGEAEFLAIASQFHSVVLEGVPRIESLEAIDSLRRFVKLLDVLYDRRVRLVVEAAVPSEDLFREVRAEIQAEDLDGLAWRTALYSADGKAGMASGAVGTLVEAVRATARAESRLREMRTRRYWNACDT